ncbi:MAG: energy-coupling factor transporter transmembrane component T family protein [bacterium]
MALLNDITFGQYFPSDSVLHRLDPRSKLLTCLVVTTCLMMSRYLYWIGIQVFLCLVAMGVSKIPFKFFAKNLKLFLWLFLITFSIHFMNIHLLGTAPFIRIDLTEQGFFNGIVYTVRLVLLITLASLLTMTTTPMELTESLEKALSPLKRFKIPVHEFAFMATLALRFIPILLREAQIIKNAQISRGLSLEGSMLQRIRNMIPMIIPLFVSAIRRADDLAVAMEARHYSGGRGRTSFHKLELKQADWLLMLFASGFLLTMLIVR